MEPQVSGFQKSNRNRVKLPNANTQNLNLGRSNPGWTVNKDHKRHGRIHPFPGLPDSQYLSCVFPVYGFIYGFKDGWTGELLLVLVIITALKS